MRSALTSRCVGGCGGLLRLPGRLQAGLAAIVVKLIAVGALLVAGAVGASRRRRGIDVEPRVAQHNRARNSTRKGVALAAENGKLLVLRGPPLTLPTLSAPPPLAIIATNSQATDRALDTPMHTRGRPGSRTQPLSSSLASRSPPSRSELIHKEGRLRMEARLLNRHAHIVLRRRESRIVGHELKLGHRPLGG